MPSHSYCSYGVSIFGYVHHFLFWQRQFNLIWFGFLSSLAPVHQPRMDIPCVWPTFWCYFCPCHIFSVVSIAILSIFFILSTVSTIVLSIEAKIRVRDLIKRFYHCLLQLVLHNLLLIYWLSHPQY